MNNIQINTYTEIKDINWNFIFRDSLSKLWYCENAPEMNCLGNYQINQGDYYPVNGQWS